LTRGFSLVRTPTLFNGDALRRLAKRRLVLPFHSKQWHRFPDLASYAHWLEALLGSALPEEPVELCSLEFRHEAAEAVDPEVDRLHADGSYIRSVYTVYGPSTVYRDAGREEPVPPGQTLLMTALDRAKAVGVPCTLHRRPGAGPKRALIVGSFEPPRQQSALRNVYRELTQEHVRKAAQMAR
jgi:hypothetical protein